MHYFELFYNIKYKKNKKKQNAQVCCCYVTKKRDNIQVMFLIG